MRGKVPTNLAAQLFDRITPAYAGKRLTVLEQLDETQDHPRLCGEKTMIQRKVKILQGSPPPMRGKERRKLAFLLLNGITPAYAGKSLAVGVLWIHDEDHPRLCGEKLEMR